MKFAVITFPGTSSDIEIIDVINALGEEAAIVKHDETSLDHFDCIILPGGTSYGDSLRPGAIARHTPVMEAVRKAADEGKPVLGIGNGFQILLEANLLPGTILINRDLKFICESVQLVVKNNETMFTNKYELDETITLPIASQYGNYYCDEQTFNELKEKKQIIFTYKEDVNGSLHYIAGIMNEKGNVLGLMPHPERAVDTFHQTTDGLPLLESLLNHWREYNAITS